MAPPSPSSSSSSSSSSSPLSSHSEARKKMEMVTKGGGGGSKKLSSLLSPRSHSDVFRTVESGSRGEVAALLGEEGVSLGMADPTTGRSLLYRVLTTVTNGDKIVIGKLDSCVSTTGEDQDQEDWAVLVDHRYLVDEDPRNMTLVTDLLQLPNKISTKVLSHPVIKTFIERRWARTRLVFLATFLLYLLFVLLFSGFLWLMYQRHGLDTRTIKVDLPAKCDKLQPVGGKQSNDAKELTNRMGPLGPERDDLIDVTISGQLKELDFRTRGVVFKDDEVDLEDFEISLEVKKTRVRKKARANKKLRLFASCCSQKKCRDIDLCCIEICLVITIALLLTQEFWQMLALGQQYLRELENWFELVIVSLAITTLCLKHEADLDSLKIVSAVAICLAWIELIFLFGRYPFLGGMFSIMYYSITKRIIRTALGFFILVCAFAFAFFIIHFNNETESFDSFSRSVIKVFVMVLGEFEFDDLWTNSASSSGGTGLSQTVTMLLLVLLIIFGSVTMVNLIVAIIITDIAWLHKVSSEQVLLNQAHHVVQIHALFALFRCISRRKVVDSASTHRDPLAVLKLEFCLHSVCRCGKDRPGRETREDLMALLESRKK